MAEKKKPGRPLGSRNKSHKDPQDLRSRKYSIKFSPAEWEIIVTSAEQAGIRISDFIRGRALTTQKENANAQ